MKKKIIRIIAVVSACALMAGSLAACGSNNSSQSTTQAATEAVTETTTEKETTTAKETTTEKQTTTAEATTAAKTDTQDQTAAEVGAPADDFEALCREIALQTAGEGSTVISAELRHDGIGDWLDGDYYYIGVQKADGSQEYYYCRTDWALTQAEVDARSNGSNEGSEAQGESAGIGEPADDFEALCREIALSTAGEGSTVISSELRHDGIGDWLDGDYYYIGVQRPDGSQEYYYCRTDWALTQAEVDARSGGSDEGSEAQGEGEGIGEPTDDFEALCRDIALQTAGEGSTVISAELRHDGIGDWLDGDYYYIGVQKADGSVEYYYCRTDWALTEEEIANR